MVPSSPWRQLLNLTCWLLYGWPSPPSRTPSMATESTWMDRCVETRYSKKIKFFKLKILLYNGVGTTLKTSFQLDDPSTFSCLWWCSNITFDHFEEYFKGIFCGFRLCQMITVIAVRSWLKVVPWEVFTKLWWLPFQLVSLANISLEYFTNSKY